VEDSIDEFAAVAAGRKGFVVLGAPTARRRFQRGDAHERTLPPDTGRR
jgi:hypothetical protein